MNSFVRFNYLYRDAGNYKSWGEAIFSNPDSLGLQDIDRRLRLRFDQEIFVAHQIDIPEVFLHSEQAPNSDDHCFHEYDSVEVAVVFDSKPDNRSIKQFIEEVESASKNGWEVFCPQDAIRNVTPYGHTRIEPSPAR